MAGTAGTGQRPAAGRAGDVAVDGGPGRLVRPLAPDARHGGHDRGREAAGADATPRGRASGRVGAEPRLAESGDPAGPAGGVGGAAGGPGRGRAVGGAVRTDGGDHPAGVRFVAGTLRELVAGTLRVPKLHLKLRHT